MFQRTKCALCQEAVRAIKRRGVVRRARAVFCVVLPTAAITGIMSLIGIIGFLIVLFFHRSLMSKFVSELLADPLIWSLFPIALVTIPLSIWLYKNMRVMEANLVVVLNGNEPHLHFQPPTVTGIQAFMTTALGEEVKITPRWLKIRLITGVVVADLCSARNEPLRWTVSVLMNRYGPVKIQLTDSENDRLSWNEKQLGDALEFIDRQILVRGLRVDNKGLVDSVETLGCELDFAKRKGESSLIDLYALEAYMCMIALSGIRSPIVADVRRLVAHIITVNEPRHDLSWRGQAQGFQRLKELVPAVEFKRFQPNFTPEIDQACNQAEAIAARSEPVTT